MCNFQQKHAHDSDIVEISDEEETENKYEIKDKHFVLTATQIRSKTLLKK